MAVKHMVWGLGVMVLAAGCGGAQGEPEVSRQGGPDQAPSSEATASTSDATDPERFIGLRYENLPAGVRSLAGSLISGDTGPEYAVSYVESDSTRMAWLERGSGSVDGRVVWDVVDVLVLPPMEGEEYFALGSCGADPDTQDHALMAVVRYEDEEVQTDIRTAWRADTRSESFEEVPADGVVCVNERW